MPGTSLIVHALRWIYGEGVGHEAILSYAGGIASAWMVSFVKHMPAAKRTHPWRGAAFDATQDAFKNSERIGERRDILNSAGTPQKEDNA